MSKTQQKFKEKVVLITGASRGLGSAFAQFFSEAGATVVITARRLEKLNVLSDKLNNSTPGQVMPYQLDLTDSDKVPVVLAKIFKEVGPVSVLINNAGVTVEKENFMAHSLEDWKKVIDTNLTATWLITQIVAKEMIEKEIAGSIINVSSVAGTRAHMQSSPAYGASKAAINHLTRALACELGKWGIRINTLAPGGIVTNESTWQEENFAQKLVEKIPMRRYGKLEDLREAVYYLSGDDSAYMTGGILQIDGGLCANQL